MRGALLPTGEYAPSPTNSYTYDFSALDIGKVISYELRIPLRNKGINPAPCCGHNDCFKVNAKKGYYYCFSTGCGATGNILKFIVMYKGMTYQEASKYIINKYFTNNQNERK